MHGDVPEIASNAWGKDTVCAGDYGDAMPCAGVTGLCTMSQQGLMSVTGHNSIPPLRTLPQGPKCLGLANWMPWKVWWGLKFGCHGSF